MFVSALFMIGILARPLHAEQPLTQLSLNEAIRLAVRFNATLRAKAQEVQSTQTGEITAALRPNPTASYVSEQYGLPGGTPQHTSVKPSKPVASGVAGSRAPARPHAWRATSSTICAGRRSFK